MCVPRAGVNGMYGPVEFSCAPYLQLLSSWWDTVPISAVVLDKRKHGAAPRSLAKTPKWQMMMRSNNEAFEY